MSQFSFNDQGLTVDWIGLDLNYLRQNKTNDKTSSRQFLENCQRNLSQTNKILV